MDIVNFPLRMQAKSSQSKDLKSTHPNPC